jgi:uncharacterized protein YecE (DUF72 family)
MKLYVGLTNLIGHVATYAERFDVLEVRYEPERGQTAKGLRRLRATAPEKLVFSVLIPPQVSSPALEKPELLAPVLEIAELLRARFLVVQTGSDVGPSPRARGRLAALARALTSGDRRVAWEPRGPWEPEVASAMARENGLVLVEDLSMVDAQPSELVYTRLRVPGPGAALRGGAIERLAEQLTDAQEAYVVIEGRGSARARSMITQAVAAAVAAAADESDDSELEEDDFEPLSGSLEDDEEDFDDEDGDDEDEDESAEEDADASDDDLEGRAEDQDDEDGDGDDDEDDDEDEEDEDVDEDEAPRRRR